MRVILPNDLKTISTVVCAHFALSEKELHARSNEQRIVRPRQIVWHLCYKLCGASQSAIGAAFDCHCGTVRKGIARVLNLMGTEPQLLLTVKQLESRCQLLLEANK